MTTTIGLSSLQYVPLRLTSDNSTGDELDELYGLNTDEVCAYHMFLAENGVNILSERASKEVLEGLALGVKET